MKKLSLSLFALLAIVFAVTSAFTTKSDAKANHYKVWGIQQTQVTTPASYSALAAKVAGTFYDSPTILAGATNQQKLDDFITSYNGSHAPDITCASDPGFACVAFVNDGTSTVLAVNDGDFSLQ